MACPFYPSGGEKEWDKTDLRREGGEEWGTRCVACSLPALHQGGEWGEESLRHTAPSSITIFTAEWESSQKQVSISEHKEPIDFL